MRPYTPKRAKHNRQVQPIRDQYLWEFPACQYPGCQSQATDIHEIARGASRSKSLGIRASLLNLCRTHHDHVHQHPSVARDLAVKLMADPVGYDRRRINALRHRAPDAISADEVDGWVKTLSGVTT